MCWWTRKCPGDWEISGITRVRGEHSHMVLISRGDFWPNCTLGAGEWTVATVEDCKGSLSLEHVIKITASVIEQRHWSDNGDLRGACLSRNRASIEIWKEEGPQWRSQGKVGTVHRTGGTWSLEDWRSGIARMEAWYSQHPTGAHELGKECLLLRAS